MSSYLIINGPNLNLLGMREPEIYGSETLDNIIQHTEYRLSSREVNLEWFQSNIEGEIIDRIQASITQGFNGIIINPGAYSHTSIGILDALSVVKIPVVEVHISQTNKREEFRRIKLTARAAQSIMEGFGRDSYYLAIFSLLIKDEENNDTNN